MSANIIGLDIGGANLKAASADPLIPARIAAFELWKRPDQLAAALGDLLAGWKPDRLAVTMTGELCDCFETKRDGVRSILASVECAFPGVPLAVWSTDSRFVSIDEARGNPHSVAAANWHAQATAIARFSSPAVCPRILVDVGSTTTDIIPIIDDRVAATGLTDSERLRSGELVYTGFRRTPICALIPDGIAAELFAATLDAYLLLGFLPDDPGDRQTADGRPATAEFAHSRMARMLGGDSETVSKETTLDLARRVFTRQRTMLAQAIRKVAARFPNEVYDAMFSGSGELLGQAAWEDSGLRACFISMSERVSQEYSTAACAGAIARLLQRFS